MSLPSRASKRLLVLITLACVLAAILNLRGTWGARRPNGGIPDNPGHASATPTVGQRDAGIEAVRDAPGPTAPADGEARRETARGEGAGGSPTLVNSECKEFIEFQRRAYTNQCLANPEDAERNLARMLSLNPWLKREDILTPAFEEEVRSRSVEEEKQAHGLIEVILSGHPPLRIPPLIRSGNLSHGLRRHFERAYAEAAKVGDATKLRSIASVYALAWNEETIQFFRTQALGDSGPAARIAATTLAEHGDTLGVRRMADSLASSDRPAERSAYLGALASGRRAREEGTGGQAPSSDQSWTEIGRTLATLLPITTEAIERSQIVEALSWTDDPQRRALLEQVDREQDRFVRGQIVSRIYWAAEWPPDTVEFVKARATGADATVRAMFVPSLARLARKDHWSKEALQRLASSDPDDTVRSEAARYLEGLTSPVESPR